LSIVVNVKLQKSVQNIFSLQLISFMKRFCVIDLKKWMKVFNKVPH